MHADRCTDGQADRRLTRLLYAYAKGQAWGIWDQGNDATCNEVSIPPAWQAPLVATAGQVFVYLFVVGQLVVLPETLSPVLQRSA